MIFIQLIWLQTKQQSVSPHNTFNLTAVIITKDAFNVFLPSHIQWLTHYIVDCTVSAILQEGYGAVYKFAIIFNAPYLIQLFDGDISFVLFRCCCHMVIRPTDALLVVETVAVHLYCYDVFFNTGINYKHWPLLSVAN